MSEEIRYGAGGVPYKAKAAVAPKEKVKKAEVKDEVISEILIKNPNKEDKEENKKD
jgi:hypothetical protein|tara:strand:+ start:220 stop:387 length:168 start_codon:yes stop_codon:yes gene_type:complete